MPVLDSDRNLSVERKLKNFATKTSKDFGIALKNCNNSIAQKTKRTLKVEINTPKNITNFCDNQVFERSAIEKKIRERKKLIINGQKHFEEASLEIEDGEEKVFKSNKLLSPQDTVYHLISKLYLIIKFIKSLKNATFVRRPNKFQIERMDVLQDPTFFKEGLSEIFFNNNNNIEKKEASKCKEKMLTMSSEFGSFCRHCYDFLIYHGVFKYLVVFDPETNLRSFWDALHLVVFSFYFFKIPVELSFDVYFSKLTNEALFSNIASCLDYFGVCFLFLDVLFNFNTGYYKKGYLIVSRKMIAKHYFQTSFSYDFLSFIGVLFDFFQFPGSQKLKFLFFFRVSNFFRIFSRIEESIHINFKVFNILTLLKVVARILLLSHIFACGWHYISHEEFGLRSDSWWFFEAF